MATKRISLGRIFLVGALFLAGTAVEPIQAQQVVTFPDSELDDVLRFFLRIPNGNPIMDTDMARVISLSATRVHDTSGLEWAKNAQSISLMDSPVTNVGPLAGLQQLNMLVIEGHRLADLSPLENLTNLNTLYLVNGMLTSPQVASLSRVTSLGSLMLDDNRICDLSWAGSLSNLTDLSLSGNPITDIGPLAGLTNLCALSLAKTEVTDLSPLSGMNDLGILDITGLGICDYSLLSGHPNLTELRASDNCFSDISFLATATWMYSLELSNNGISDISDLSGIEGIEVLALAGNGIIDISPLGGQEDLKWVTLGGNRIVDISPLGGKDIYELDLSDNCISDISSLTTSQIHFSLDLRGNPLNSAAYEVYIPAIREQNPGVKILYDLIPEPATGLLLFAGMLLPRRRGIVKGHGIFGQT